MICLTPRPAELPRNETKEHFFLKQIALVWLRVNVHCHTAAPEIWGFKRYRDENSRDIADVVGLKRQLKWEWDEDAGRPRYAPHYTIYVVEVKVSRSDFAAGYCVGGHYSYVLTPPGLVSPDELEPEVGLIECDPVRFAWEPRRLRNLTVRRKARRRKVPDEKQQAYTLLERISWKLSNLAVWHSPWIRQVGSGEPEPSNWEELA